MHCFLFHCHVLCVAVAAACDLYHKQTDGLHTVMYWIVFTVTTDVFLTYFRQNPLIHSNEKINFKMISCTLAQIVQPFWSIKTKLLFNISLSLKLCYIFVKILSFIRMIRFSRLFWWAFSFAKCPLKRKNVFSTSIIFPPPSFSISQGKWEDFTDMISDGFLLWFQ